MAQLEQPRMVTPEAVALEFTTANVGSRILAFVIDAAIVTVVSFLGILPLALTDATLPDWLVASILVILIPGWYFGYFTVSETLWRGRTVGKAALGLRVVTKEGGPVRFRHAAIRTLLGLVDFGIGSGFFAILLILLTRDNQRLGDLLAGTLVLRERSGLPAPAPVSFDVPAGLEPFTATLDVSGLTIEQYQAVRTFLLRTPSLAPQPRASLALQLASPLAERLRPPPPAGVPPELYLRCVAAAYQRRQRPAGSELASRAAAPASAWGAVPQEPHAPSAAPVGSRHGRDRVHHDAGQAVAGAADRGGGLQPQAEPEGAPLGAGGLDRGGGREPLPGRTCAGLRLHVADRLVRQGPRGARPPRPVRRGVGHGVGLPRDRAGRHAATAATRHRSRRPQHDPGRLRPRTITRAADGQGATGSPAAGSGCGWIRCLRSRSGGSAPGRV